MNGRVCFPAGVYTGDFGATISGQTWVAQGAKVTGGANCLVVFAPNVTLVAFEVYGCTGTGITVAGYNGATGVKLLGNKVYNVRGNGIFADNGSHYVIVDNNTVTNVGGYGIIVHHATNARITNNDVAGDGMISIELWGIVPDGYIAYNTVVGGSAWLSLDGGDRTVIEYNHVTATTGSQSSIEVVASDNAIVRHNTVDGNNTLSLGISILGGSDYIQVYANRVSQTTDGIYVGWGSQGINPANGRIDNNDITFWHGGAIRLQGAEYFTVTNNRMTTGAPGSLCIAQQITPGLVLSGNTCS